MTSSEALPSRVDIRDAVTAGHHRLTVVGELDMASAGELEAAVDGLRSPATTAITLDLSEVLFMDSTGLRAVLAGHKLCMQEGYEFNLIPGPPAVQRLFELTGLLDSLPFRREDQ